MIWLKRLLPVLVILLAWYGWRTYSASRAEQAAALDLRNADITARVWVASANLRSDAPAFLAYRDSLLSANNITTDELFRYLDLFERDMERQFAFSQLVSKKVDSMVRVADSLQKIEPAKPKTDTALGAPAAPSLLPPDSALLNSTSEAESRLPVPE
ncbi:MAG: hypothetical protein NDJ18_01245 [candidate division Zixibacteria bacterium]|nr:hypothetical protein [candidate division Zixibacteria bacterium]